VVIFDQGLNTTALIFLVDKTNGIGYDGLE
jgi:hypothetical protein